MERILSIDPSGTGTTGVYFKDGDQEMFISYQDRDWKKHWQFVHGLVKQWHPQFLLFENFNYVSLRGKDMTSLLRLLGAMETLSLPCSTLPKIKTIPVDQVKGLKSKLLKEETQIPGLTYQPGRGKGWSFKGKKISVHGLDAYLVYWLWQTKEQQNNKLIGKSIGEIKIEPSYKENKPWLKA